MKITVTLSAVALVAILVLYSPYRARTDYCLHCQRSHDTLSWLVALILAFSGFRIALADEAAPGAAAPDPLA